jgi:FkbM family methyltransferase
MKYDFVEIGCSIAKTYADRFGLECRGLLVEPMPNLFKVVPSSDTVLKENVAITEHDGEVSMYTYDFFSVDKNYEYLGDNLSNIKSVPKGWGVSSIDKNPNPQRKVNGKTTVKCLTLKTLFNNYGIDEIDYFKVDAEGHDHIILNQLYQLMLSGLIINKEIVFEYDLPLANKSKLDKTSHSIEKIFNFERKIVGHDLHLIKK